MYDVCDGRGGGSSFEANLPRASQAARVSRCLSRRWSWRASRRVDEWRLVESGFGQFRVLILLADVGRSTRSGSAVWPWQSKSCSNVDGERTVREIVDHSHMSSFDACKILFQLLESRLVRRRLA